MTFEDVRDLLTQKFSDEKKRLKSFGTKANSFDLANVVTRYVQAYACRARYEELKQLKKWIHKNGMEPTRLKKYIDERKGATKKMSVAIFNVAEHDSRNRPWKRKEIKHKHKHKHKHRKDKKKHDR